MSFTMPGLPSLVYLGYLFLYFPWAALRSARRIRASGGGLPSRSRIWVGTLVSQIFLFILAWIVASSFGYAIFAWAPQPVHFAYAAGALALLFVLRIARRAARTETERQGMVVHELAPRTPREVALSVATILVAGVAEEAAYRGVAMQVLWYTTGNPYLSAGLCAAAFAAAHAVQGRNSAIMIFGVALVMHGLVALTGSLVPAMIVHILYDLVAGWLIRKEAMRLVNA